MTEAEIKEAVRARDGHRCIDCGISQDDYCKNLLNRKRAVLDVHRKSPGSVYSIEGCVTLCRTCHRRRHSANPRPKRIVKIRYNDFADIRELLELSGWSPAQLGGRLDVTEASVRKWIIDGRCPRGPAAVLMRQWLDAARADATKDKGKKAVPA